MIDRPVVLITGGSRGLGQAIAMAFSKQGFAVALNYHAKEDPAKETQKRLDGMGTPTLLLKADVRSSKEVNPMMDAIDHSYGRLDVLVNNAGLSRDKTLARMSDEDWRDVLAVHLDGAFYCTRAALPLMRSQKEGSIINVSSYLAYRVTVGAANYAVAKAGLIALTKSTALEEGRHKIRANAVLPGFHVTDMNREVWTRYENVIRSQHLLERLPDKEEMAQFVVKVATLKTVTGQVFAFESRLL